MLCKSQIFWALLQTMLAEKYAQKHTTGGPGSGSVAVHAQDVSIALLLNEVSEKLRKI